MTREASIQLTYQLCIMIQSLLYFPLRELASFNLFKIPNGASIQWISGLLLQIVSIATSAYCTISLPLHVNKNYDVNLPAASVLTLMSCSLIEYNLFKDIESKSNEVC